MSSETEPPEQNDPETDQASLETLAETEAANELLESTATEESPSDNSAEFADDNNSGDAEDIDTTIGEWSLCASMIFLAGYLVLAMFWYLSADNAVNESVWATIVSFEVEQYRTAFPVGVATILLLISVLSAFCSYISLVADKNNRRTLLIRLVTLGPLLPTAVAGFMVWVIIQRGAGKSILENFLG
jgi:hypothetical protein